MRRIFVVFLCFYFRIFHLVKGDCVLNNDVVRIDTTQVGVQLKNYTFSETTEFVSFHIQDTGNTVPIDTAQKYFEFTVVDSALAFSTTKDFANVGKDADSNGQLILMNIYVTLNCSDGEHQSIIQLIITDAFSNQPIFSAESYSYKVPMPIMQKTDITVFGDGIAISDVNFANVGITLSISPVDFEMNATKVDNKQFTAVFRAKKILQLSESKTYTLTATNSGNKSAEVKITVEADATTGLDSPSFVKAYYSFNYSIEGLLIPNDGNIVITSSKPDEAQYKLDDASSPYFTIAFDTSSKIFTLSLKTGITVLFTTNQLILTLSYTTDDTTNTVLLVNVLNEEILPKFTSDYYSGTYDMDTKEITWHTKVQVTNAASVKLINGNSDLFTIDSSTYVIKPTKDLSKSDFDSNSNIVFTVTATSTSKTEASAVVIVSLKEANTEDLAFKKGYYQATYKEENGKEIVSLDSGNDIGFTGISDFTGITIDVDPSYRANFKIYLDSESKWKITVQEGLNVSVLNKNTQLTIPVIAKKTDVNQTATAVLIVALPEKVEIKFDDSYYSASYKKGSEKDLVILDKEITITGAEANKINMTIEGYEANFELIKSSDSSYKINVKSDLNSTILASPSPLVILMTAEVGSTEVETVLILKLPSQELVLEFAKAHYQGQYTVDKDSTGKVTLDDAIQISKSDDLEPKFKFEGLSDELELKLSSGNSYEINVKSNLNASILDSSTQLITTIIAYTTENTLSSYTTLVLDLPLKKSSLEFDKKHYYGEYLTKESHAMVNLTDGPIKINNADQLKLQFSYEDYEDYFKLETNDSSSYTINVKKNLDPTIINQSSQIIMALTASTTDGSSTGSTVVVIDIQKEALEFEKHYYRASYTSAPSITLDEVLTFKNQYSSSNIQISFEGYNDVLKSEYDSSNRCYNIKTIDVLNNTILFSQGELIVTVKATENGATATTLLAIKLPSAIMNVFEEDFYTADYTQSSNYEIDRITLYNPIKIKSDEYTALSFEGYDDIFKGSCDSNTLECTLSAKNNLNSSILSSLDELLLTLIASNTDGSNIGKTVLLINLPAKNSTFSFNQPYFRGIYSIEKSDGENASIKLTDLIGLNGDNDAEISIVADEYTQYFSFNKRLLKWSLTLLKNFDADILSKNTELVATLTAKRQSAIADYAKATLIIKLPDSMTVTFNRSQYYGEYVVNTNGDGARVVMDNNSGIELTDTDNSKVVLDSFSEVFEPKQSTNSKWTINVKEPLNATVLTTCSELKLVLTVTKVGVSYGKAALTIKLPLLSFLDDEYSAMYSVDEDQKVNVTLKEEIAISNIDTSLVDISLAKYNEYFVTELTDNKWTLKLHGLLPDSITSKYSTLVTNLLAIKKSDGKTLASATLIISITQSDNSSEIPSFSTFTFYGAYEFADGSPRVNLTHPIGLADGSVDATKVYIDSSDEYSTNFSMKDEGDKTYSVVVSVPLEEDVLDEVSSIVFTLVAEAQGGARGYATLAIALPKAKRNSSVIIENNEILFTGTYKDGEFTCPQIAINTNSTNDDDISIQITNDLHIDASYFPYTYSKKTLTVQVKKLPGDIVNSTSVIPLRLAITDLTTTDTVYAVLNVEISYEGGGGGGGGGSNGGNDDGSTPVGLIAAVAVLAFLLILIIVGGIIFWYCKFRVRTRYADMTTTEEIATPTKPTTFTKNEPKKPTTTTLSSSSLRRPTGIAVGLTSIHPNGESSSDQVNADFVNESEKKVAFDDKVEKIDDYKVASDEEEEPESLQSVANRRPTEFVFGYPLELGVLDANERRESSDFPTQPEAERISPERKKSVAFDENVERLHIDPTEDDEEETSIFKTQVELQIKNEEKLPSQVFKEIF